MPTTAAALAPELMPMMSGLASGLRSMRLEHASRPAPNAAPTSTASTARGSRFSEHDEAERRASLSPRDDRRDDVGSGITV